MQFQEQFPHALYPVLTRKEVIDIIDGRSTTRPAVVVHGQWVHIDELKQEHQSMLYAFHERFPCDIQPFYMGKPALFEKSGNTYCWCDVEGADPSLERDVTKTIAMDEKTTISWDVIDRISEKTPDFNHPDVLKNVPFEDGRYRMMIISLFLFCRLWEYRGISNSLMDMYLEPERIHALNRKVTNFFKGAITRAVKEAHIDAVSVADDLGMQKGPFLSPEMFREFLFPYYKEIFDHAHALGIHVWMHSCGDIELLIPQLIEAGVDVLHPIQKYAMEDTIIHDKFKDQLTFWVGMDLQQILPFGTKDEVIQETRRIIDTFYHEGKGRLMLTIGNRLDDTVPIENYMAFIEEAYRYGEACAQKYRERTITV